MNQTPDKPLLERLLRKRPGYEMARYGHVNPDGPEAVETIRELVAALETAREAIHITRHLVASDASEGNVSEAVYLNNGELSSAERKIDAALTKASQ